jgi:hypothetical protein
MRILEGVFIEANKLNSGSRIYPQSIFDREYHLKIRKMRASRRRSRIMNLFIK